MDNAAALLKKVKNKIQDVENGGIIELETGLPSAYGTWKNFIKMSDAMPDTFSDLIASQLQLPTITQIIPHIYAKNIVGNLGVESGDYDIVGFIEISACTAQDQERINLSDGATKNVALFLD